jgi:tight adherence protein B
MNNYIFAGFIFVVLIVIIELLLYAWRASNDLSSSKKVLDRLQKYSWENDLSKVAENILKTRIVSTIPFLNRVLLKINFVERLETLVRQTNTSIAPAVYLLTSALLGVVGFLVGKFMLRDMVLGLIVGFACCLLPFVWLIFKKNQRMRKFDVQLPDALDLIARSLKAGHSFSSGLKLVSENFPDPIGTEFNETIREINFGLPVAEALRNLGKRVASSDLNFFIIATILQRDTGGNLAEITETIATLIRERFKFEDKVRVLAAEGKLSAIVLIAIPFLLFFFILKRSPEYIEVLLQDPFGRMAGFGAIVLMLAGIVIIMRMTKIKM